MERSKLKNDTMTNNELLLAISDIVSKQIEPLKKELHTVRVDLLENNVIPRLSTIENCYLSTYNRYSSGADQLEAIQADCKTSITRTFGKVTKYIVKLFS